MQKSQPIKALPDDKAAGDDAPSTVDLPTLVSDRFDLINLYRALAKRHDELVDAVLKKLQEQAQ